MNHAENKKRYRINLFCIVTAIYWFSTYTYVPIFASYLEGLGFSSKVSGIIIGSYGFVQMLLRIPVGVYSDKLNKKKLFIKFGLIFSFISGIGIAYSTDSLWILLFRGLAGATASTWVDFTILFSSYFKKDETLNAIGKINFYGNIGQISAMLIGGAVAQHLGFKAPFLLGSVGALVAFVLSFFIVDNKTAGGNASDLSAKKILSIAGDKTLITVSLIAVLAQLITFSTIYGFTPVYAQKLGAGALEMSLLTVFSAVPMAIASLLSGGVLSKRFGAKNVVVIGFLLNGVFTAIIPFVNSLWILIITQAIAGFGRGASFSLLMGLSILHMSSNKRGTAMGFFQSIYGLGMFLGPALMGIMGDALNLQQGFIIIGIIGFASAALSYILITDTP